MFISHVAIKNFRALEDIDCPFGPRINVIVGPNAMGKTTILQAIRLTKALLAPRTQNEINQVLISIGAASPHFPQHVFVHTLAREQAKDIEIRCTFSLSETEIATLKPAKTAIAQSIVITEQGLSFSNPATLIPFLQSPGTLARIEGTSKLIEERLNRLATEKTIMLGLRMQPGGILSAYDPLTGPMFNLLDQRNPPSLSLFSYFPADRALPMGEAQLQMGGQDAQLQLEAHNSQPQLKYQRLKNIIINALVLQDDNKENTVQSEFEAIFRGLLRGRRIKSVGVSNLGLLSVMTEEIATGRLIELDSLSSGEKNIALTFLLVSRSVADGGVALFDEPELHLNPAVSRDLLSFMMQKYSKPREIQFLMCTHSPEILSGAYADEECTLLHLKAPSNITRIGKRALDEYANALQQLGTSVVESLLYEATVIVEGADDVQFLNLGFSEIVKKYYVTDRGGRREVEKTIAKLQELEARGDRVSPIYLIFDKDEAPSDLKSSQAVRVLQWPRRCIENFMLDTDVITELLKDPNLTLAPVQNEGEVRRRMQELAFRQLDAVAARDAYRGLGYLDASLRADDLKGVSIEELAAALFRRMSAARQSLPNNTEAAWIGDFVGKTKALKDELVITWEAKWQELCDGKRLLSDLHKASRLRASEATFKTRIIERMRDAKADSWRLAESVLKEFFSAEFAP
jgi:predicted ATPase